MEQVGQHLDLQGLKVIEATDDEPTGVSESSDPKTVLAHAQPVEPPKPAEGVKVKLANGTVRTDF